MRLDFTTTATCRPDILCRTYTSFRDNLVGVDLSQSVLFLNIDPIPDVTAAPEVERIAKAFFGRVMANVAREPNFARAVKWCWLKPGTEFFFHLEDDWVMDRPFDVGELVKHFHKNPRLASVNLRAYDCDPEDTRISLCPGVFRTEHARTIAKRFDYKHNPERQMRSITDTNPCGGRHGEYTGLQVPRNPILKDIGREWLENSGWRKAAPITFNRWHRA